MYVLSDDRRMKYRLYYMEGVVEGNVNHKGYDRSITAEVDEDYSK